MTGWRTIPVRSTVAGAILAAGMAMAIRGATLTPDAYLGMSLVARYAGPDRAHWLGRDELGRDTLNRLLAGATTTVSETLVVVAVALAVGLLLRLIGRASSWHDVVVVALARICFVAPAFVLGHSRAGAFMMAVLSALLLLPGLIVTVAAVAWFGPGPVGCVIALGLLFAVAVAYARPAPARQSLALALKVFAWSMFSLSALDAIGLGTRPPTPSWGTILGSLQSLHVPEVLAAGCLLLTASAAIMLGDAPHQAIPAKTLGDIR